MLATPEVHAKRPAIETSHVAETTPFVCTSRGVMKVFATVPRVAIAMMVARANTSLSFLGEKENKSAFICGCVIRTN